MKEVDATELVDKWLTDYHNTTLKEVKEKHGWEDGNDEHTREFYQTYPVTQEQHDEWKEWMEKRVAKVTGLGIRYTRKHSWGIYLNTSPSIKKIN